MIDKPDAKCKSGQFIQSDNPGQSGISAVGETPKPAGEPKANGPQKHSQYGKQIVGLLLAASGIIYIGARGGWKTIWGFLDRHNGSIGAIATVAIVVLTVFYVNYSRRQWQTMQGQLEQMKQQLPELQRSARAAEDGAKLARQQAIALQQAIVNMWVSDFVLESPNLTPALPMALKNDGIAIATGVSFHGAFTWKSEPHHVTVGQPIPINIEIPLLQGNKVAKSYMLRIPELNQEKLKELRTSTKARTVELSGKLTYSNGFDQVISENFCKVYFAHEQLGNSSDAGFVDCDEYAAKVKLWENLELEHRMKKQ